METPLPVRTFGRPRVVAVALGLLVSVGAAWLVISTVDLEAVVQLLSNAAVAPLVALLVVLAFQAGVRAIRWSLLLPRRHGRRIPARRTLPPMLVGYLGNALLPARLGEPARALLVARRERVSAAASFGSVVLERVIDTATLACLMLPAAWLLSAPRWILEVGLLATVIAGIVLVLLSFVGLAGAVRLVERAAGRLGSGIAGSSATKLAGMLGQFSVGAGASGRRPVIAVAALVSLGAWFLDATMFWLASVSLGATLQPSQAIVIAGVAVLGTAVPAAPGYIATYELAATAAAVALGVPAEAALAIAIVVHALTVVPMAIAGAIALAMIQRDGLGGASDEVRSGARAEHHESPALQAAP